MTPLPIIYEHGKSRHRLQLRQGPPAAVRRRPTRRNTQHSNMLRNIPPIPVARSGNWGQFAKDVLSRPSDGNPRWTRVATGRALWRTRPNLSEFQLVGPGQFLQTAQPEQLEKSRCRYVADLPFFGAAAIDGDQLSAKKLAQHR